MELVSEGEIEGKHFLHAVAIGIIAGFIIVLADNYLLAKVETAVGLPAVAA